MNTWWIVLRRGGSGLIPRPQRKRSSQMDTVSLSTPSTNCCSSEAGVRIEPSQWPRRTSLKSWGNRSDNQLINDAFCVWSRVYPYPRVYPYLTFMGTGRVAKIQYSTPSLTYSSACKLTSPAQGLQRLQPEVAVPS